MTYQTLDNLTSNGSGNDLVNILTLPTRDFPIFYPMLIFALFVIITFSLFFNQRQREGKANLLSSLAVAGFATSIITLSLSLLGAVGSGTIVFVFSVTIVFVVLFLLTKKD